MAAWARRMQRRATTLSTAVTSCGGQAHRHPYPRRIEKVKFGVELEQICKSGDLPGPLLVMILKLNKEAPLKKDAFRAPGHHGNMKKLIHSLQNGRLVNIDNFSVYTIASVLKKFLMRLPGGIFKDDMEQRLFAMDGSVNEQDQIQEVQWLVSTLPGSSQRLLVLLFGTFAAIAANSKCANTGMSSDSLGISVAPSFFQTCIAHATRTAKLEDILRFKTATRVVTFMIDHFGSSQIFSRDMYEYYARLTGRVLRYQGEWIFSFAYPRDAPFPGSRSEPNDHPWGFAFNLGTLSQGATYSSPTLFTIPEASNTQGPSITIDSCANALSHAVESGQDGFDSGRRMKEAAARMSISLGDQEMFKTDDELCKQASSYGCRKKGERKSSSSSNSSRTNSSRSSGNASKSRRINMDDLKTINRYAESTRSMSFLPQVHERQAQRMRTRSEWFLNPSPLPVRANYLQGDETTTEVEANGGSGASTTRATTLPHSGRSSLIRRNSSKDKRLLRRSSSKRDKENGSKAVSAEGLSSSGDKASLGGSGSQSLARQQDNPDAAISPQTQATLSYKPRI